MLRGAAWAGVGWVGLGLRACQHRSLGIPARSQATTRCSRRRTTGSQAGGAAILVSLHDPGRALAPAAMLPGREGSWQGREAALYSCWFNRMDK